MNSIPEAARAAVAKGVQLLDEKVPGWSKVIKLETLDMHDCSQCMLGQLFGHDIETALGAKMFGLEIDSYKADWNESAFSGNTWDDIGYMRGRRQLLGSSSEEAENIGCNIKSYHNAGYNYTDLKCAWAEVIAERRALDETGDGASIMEEVA